MKNIVVCALILISSLSYGQIGQVENIEETTIIGYNWKMNPRIDLTRVENDSLQKKYHYFHYLNAKYTSIQDFRTLGFFADQNDLDKLYQILINVMESNKEITFSLGEHQIFASCNKSTLAINVSSDTETESLFFLNRRQLERLFGKK